MRVLTDRFSKRLQVKDRVGPAKMMRNNRDSRRNRGRQLDWLPVSADYLACLGRRQGFEQLDPGGVYRSLSRLSRCLDAASCHTVCTGLDDRGDEIQSKRDRTRRGKRP